MCFKAISRNAEVASVWGPSNIRIGRADQTFPGLGDSPTSCFTKETLRTEICSLVYRDPTAKRARIDRALISFALHREAPIDTRSHQSLRNFQSRSSGGTCTQDSRILLQLVVPQSHAGAQFSLAQAMPAEETVMTNGGQPRHIACKVGFGSLVLFLNHEIALS